MKFVALAVTLLLAVGSQAASLQLDPPTALAHARNALDVYMTEVKESAQRALGQLDDTEYKEFKDLISSRIEELHTQIKVVQGSVSPITDGVVSTISELTQDFQTKVRADIDTLKVQLKPLNEKLHDVVNKHIEEYRTLLEPVVTEYQAKHEAEMAALKAKLEPVMEEMQKKIAINVEETKSALTPIIEAVREKVTHRLEDLKEIAAPYVQEYKDQMNTAYKQAKSVTAEDLAALKEKINPLVEDVKAKLQTIFQTIFETFNAKGQES
ncbi:apolipoprotein A-I-like [Hippocampus zosterae]|uniref:apolipoprotein A-I-like n=1 Tax=Hippocampus zosterae TaxID=109293 RepID=UPI00223CCB1E|nr:apolipoprotein A-I-like [Hippocampus zosterae]